MFVGMVVDDAGEIVFEGRVGDGTDRQAMRNNRSVIEGENKNESRAG